MAKVGLHALGQQYIPSVLDQGGKILLYPSLEPCSLSVPPRPAAQHYQLAGCAHFQPLPRPTESELLRDAASNLCFNHPPGDSVALKFEKQSIPGQSGGNQTHVIKLSHSRM